MWGGLNAAAEFREDEARRSVPSEQGGPESKGPAPSAQGKQEESVVDAGERSTHAPQDQTGFTPR